MIWGGRRKAAAAPPPCISKGLNGNGSRLRLQHRSDRADRPRRRSGWREPQRRLSHHHRPLRRLRLAIGADISSHLQQFPNGIGEKYIGEGRLALEVSRSFRKWSDLPPLAGNELAQWTSEWMNGVGGGRGGRMGGPDRDCGPGAAGRSGAARGAPADVEDDPELREEAPQKPSRGSEPEPDGAGR